MKKVLFTLILFAAGALLGACASGGNPTIDAKGTPSFDGLLPVTGTRMKQVWARKDLNLDAYSKFMVVGAGLQFRPVRSTSRSSVRRSNAFPLSPEQQAKLATIVNEEFSKALTKVTELELVDEPGPDVLMVRGGIIDIVSRVPPERPGRSEVYLDSVGQATFVVELIDSETSAVLVRGIETRAAETPGYTVRSNRVTNTAEVRKLAAYWAGLLTQALNTLAGDPELHGDPS